ncbi:unnamed protein product, partial [Urochloa humidicola]
ERSCRGRAWEPELRHPCGQERSRALVVAGARSRHRRAWWPKQPLHCCSCTPQEHRWPEPAHVARIGGSGMDLRNKARTLSGPVTDPSKLPKWNYDGSSTGQAPGEDSEVILHPQAIFKDPFRKGNNILVMCDCYTPAGEPIPTNKRYNAPKIFSNPEVAAEEPWYGIEQEYTLLQKDTNWPP